MTPGTDMHGRRAGRLRAPATARRQRALNFTGKNELAALIAPVATEYHFRILDNFWLVEYEIGTAPK